MARKPTPKKRPQRLQPGKEQVTPTKPTIHASEINQTLQAISDFCNQQAKDYKDPSTMYIHPRVVSYTTSTNQANWRGEIPDDKERDRIQDVKTGAGNSRVGRQSWGLFFSTWQENWIGDKSWDEKEWHCWSAIMMRQTRGGDSKEGKHLLIFDPSPTVANPARADVHRLMAVQIKLCEFLRKEGPLTVWYHTTGQHTKWRSAQKRGAKIRKAPYEFKLVGWMKCLPRAMEMIRKAAQIPDLAMDEDKLGLRLEGFEKLDVFNENGNLKTYKEGRVFKRRVLERKSWDLRSRKGIKKEDIKEDGVKEEGT